MVIAGKFCECGWNAHGYDPADIERRYIEHQSTCPLLPRVEEEA